MSTASGTDPAIRILVLEDDTELREILEDVLRDEGYEVQVAASGEDAVTLAGKYPFELMVLDVRLPGMDGIEAFSRVRSERPDVGGIVITGYAAEADSIRAIHAGVSAYLKKPFHVSELLESLKKQVASRRVHDQRVRREQLMHRLLVWLLEHLLRWQPAPGSHGPRVQGVVAGRVALGLARAEELAPDGMVDVQVGAMLGSVHALLGDDFPLPPDACCPPGLRRVLRSLDDRVPLDMSREASVVRLAMEVARRVPRPWSTQALPSAHLKESGGGERFPSRLLEALDRAWESIADEEADLSESWDTCRHQRRLLSLGQALLAAGDRDGARRAFVDATESSIPSRETVEGFLNLARLARAEGDLPALRSTVRCAVSLAVRVGPASSGHACLNGGILFQSTGWDEEAGLLLCRAREFFQHLGFEPESALCTIASLDPGDATHGDEVIRALCAISDAASLCGYEGWLFGRLCRLQAAYGLAGCQSLLERLARDCSKDSSLLLEQSGFNRAERVVAACAFAGQGLDARPHLPSLAEDEEEEVRRTIGVPLESAPRVQAVLRVCALGSLEVHLGHVRVPEASWKTQKHKHLFAYLMAHHGTPVSNEVIIDRFWPDDAERGRSSLYVATSILRALLRVPGQPQGVEWIVRRRGLLYINPDLPRWHDVEELEKAHLEVTRLKAAGRHDEMLEWHRRIIALYRGHYLEDCYMDWAAEYRTRLETMALESVILLAGDALARERPLQALEYARRGLEIDRCCQDLYHLAMRALLELNRPEEAVRMFETCGRTLASELAVEPSAILWESHAAARRALGW